MSVASGCRVEFSRLEVVELVSATVLLSVIFVISYQWNLTLALILGASGLMLHELGHKIVGRLRCIRDVHFTLSPFGIGLGFLGAVLIGHAVAAPGGVTVGEDASDNDRLLMALGGPMTNFVFFFVFFGLHVYAPWEWMGTVGAAQSVPVWLIAAVINLYLGFFNLLPIPMFDGSHILRLSKPVWAVSILSFSVLAYFTWSVTASELSLLFEGTFPGVIGLLLDGSWQKWLLPLYPGLTVGHAKELRMSSMWLHTAADRKYKEL